MRATGAPAPHQSRTAAPVRTGAGAGMVSAAKKPVQRTGGGAGATRTTPQLLRLWMTVSIISAVVFGFCAAVTVIGTANAQTRAADNTAQALRLQELHAELLQADSLATNAFLVQGKQPAQRRESYELALANAARLAVEAAQAQSDRDLLVQVNENIAEYAAAMERARALGTDGKTDLQRASQALRADTLPLLDTAAEDNRLRAVDEIESFGSPWLYVTGILALVVLLGCSVWCAVRFRRVLNLPLMTATVLIATMGGLSILAVNTASSNADWLLESDVAANVSLARIAGNEARAQESSGLLAKSATESERIFAEQDALVEQFLTDANASEVLSEWKQYVKIHQAIRRADDAGDRQAAIALAAGNKSAQSFHGFGQFDQAAAILAADAGAQTVQSLESGSMGLVVMGWALFPGALLAAGCAGVGLRTRLREYGP